MGAIGVTIQCDWCQERDCRKRGEFLQRYFFGMLHGDPPWCETHDPLWWRGVPGVMP